ncbi:hypothetical protein JT131_01705 [Helicobacter pylori]|nr:hypothetical protein [Helicobacter pylori]
MLTRKALFFKVCMDISYPKKTSGILTSFSLNIAQQPCTYISDLKDGVFRAVGIKLDFS